MLAVFQASLFLARSHEGWLRSGYELMHRVPNALMQTLWTQHTAKGVPGGAAVDVAISGTMDLVVERDDAVWVVDYKTNRELDPRTYQGQMSVYRAAAAHLFSRPVELRLFGLRRGEAYEVSDRMEDIVRLLQLP